MLRDITTRLDDHDPGEKLLHEASAEIKALRSKLDARDKLLYDIEAALRHGNKIEPGSHLHDRTKALIALGPPK